MYKSSLLFFQYSNSIFSLLNLCLARTNEGKLNYAQRKVKELKTRKNIENGSKIVVVGLFWCVVVAIVVVMYIFWTHRAASTTKICRPLDEWYVGQICHTQNAHKLWCGANSFCRADEHIHTHTHSCRYRYIRTHSWATDDVDDAAE